VGVEEIEFGPRMIWVDEGLYAEPNMAEQLGEHKLRRRKEPVLMFSGPDKVAALKEFCEGQAGITTVDVPEMVIEEGKEGEFFRGDKAPIITGYKKVYDKSGELEPVIEYEEVGVRVRLSEVKRFADADVEVMLEMEKTEVGIERTWADEQGNLQPVSEIKTNRIKGSVRLGRGVSVLFGGWKLGGRYWFLQLSVG